MSQDDKKHSASLQYVFVVLFLASFLLLFTIFRSPNITYQTAATLRTGDASENVESRLMDPAFMAKALYDSQLVQTDDPKSKTLEAIASDILQRTSMRSVHDGTERQSLVTLETKNPEAAIKLLDTLMALVKASEPTVVDVKIQPAAIARLEGGSVTAGQLIVVTALSLVMALCGVVLQLRANGSTKIFTSEDVSEASGLPVLGDLVNEDDFPDRHQHRVRRLVSASALRIAELSIAAVFLVMAYQMFTRDQFPNRFLNNPLAAYGEALTYLF